ncbi:MAG: CapA family protein [Oscillospiraceae bacterium]|nr:CapA family protein [Oscillospiraceae bacterium]
MRRIQIYLLSALLALGLFGGCGKKEEGAPFIMPSAPSAAVAAVPDKFEASFVAVGDNLIHDTVYKDAYNKGGGKYDFTYAYQNIKPYIQGHDIAFINQETLVSRVHGVASYPCFNSPIEVAYADMDMGFNVIGHSNNHMFDKGEKGLADTIAFWKEQDVCLVGAHDSEEDLHTVQYTENNNITVGWVGTTQWTNGLGLPKGSQLRYIHADERDLLAQKIAETKAACDVVAVSVHWGSEGTHKLTSAQKSLAQWLCDQGVDIIVGGHSHTIQPITWLTGKDGQKTLCIYSMGNFISSQSSSYNMLAGMVELKLEKDIKSGKVNIKDVYYDPIVTHYTSGMRNFTVYRLVDYTESLANSHGVRSYDSFSLSYLKDTYKNVIDREFYRDEVKTYLGVNE